MRPRPLLKQRFEDLGRTVVSSARSSCSFCAFFRQSGFGPQTRRRGLAHAVKRDKPRGRLEPPQESFLGFISRQPTHRRMASCVLEQSGFFLSNVQLLLDLDLALDVEHPCR